MGEKIEMTQEEFKSAKQIAVIEAQLGILIKDFQTHKADLQIIVSKIFDKMNELPTTITQCRDDLEQDIHNELERHYATDSDLKALRTDMDNGFKELRGRFKWTVMLIVGGAGVIQFIATMVFLSLQIGKLVGATS